MAGNDTPRLVDIGGRRLALRAAGRGMPTVVLEMGLGAAGSFYDAIAGRLAAFTGVVWYDHAGLGQSEPAPTPRTVEDLARDLHLLLGAAAIPPPYLLVGHSLGGLTVRLYRERHPADVAGMALVDAAHEDQRERLLAALPPPLADEPAALARLRHGLAIEWTDPAANDKRIDNLANTTLMHACGGLGATPLMVISRGRADRDPALFPPGLVDRLEGIWWDLQRDLAGLSTDSRHIRAEHSGHLVNRDQPELLVETIRHMVLRLRAAPAR